MMSKGYVNTQGDALSPLPATPERPTQGSPQGDAVVVAFTGDISLETSPLLRERLLAISAEGGTAPVIVDLWDVPFMDSAGFAALVAGRKALADVGRALSVRLKSGSQTCRNFELMRLNAVIPRVHMKADDEE